MMRKLISVLVIQSFLLSNIAFAETLQTKPNTPQNTQTLTNASSIAIEKEYGLIKSRFMGNSNKLIVNIQDAHCNYEAQTNIVRILETLIKNHNLSLISVEGADGIIDTTWFKAFPDEEVRKEVATYFMKKGEITGPEFLSITQNYAIKLFGAEDRAAYIQNLNAFTSSYPLKADTEKYYNSIKGALNKLKGFIYSNELRAMDAKAADYDSKKMQFNDYIRFLQEMAERRKLNVRSYENFFRLVSVLGYEKKIDFNVTDRERSALIDELSKLLDKDGLSDMVAQSIAFKSGKISSVDFYAYLKKCTIDKNIDLAKKYPNLYNYIIYNSVYSKIDNERLFTEIKTVETDIKERLFTNDDQRTLDKLSRHIDILIGMVNIKLLNGDFNYYQTHKDDFTHDSFAGFIKKKGEQYGLAYALEPPSDAVAKAMPKLEDFYMIATKRDKALVENTLKEMDREKQSIAVLVTGGFHSEGMSRLLEKSGVSYIVVCPTITKDVPSPYIQILTNQRTPIEDILTAPDTAKQRMLAPISRAQLVTMEPKKLKVFLRASPVEDAKTKDLIERVIDNNVEFRDDWFFAIMRDWLRKTVAVNPNHRLTREKAAMLEAYMMGMQLSLENCLHETWPRQSDAKITAQAKKMLEAIAATPGFNDAFERAFTAVAPKAELDMIRASAKPAGKISLAEAYSSPELFNAYILQAMKELTKVIPELPRIMSEYSAWRTAEVEPLEAQLADMQKRFDGMESDPQADATAVAALKEEIRVLTKKIGDMIKKKVEPVDDLISEKYNQSVAESYVGSLENISTDNFFKDIPLLEDFMKSPEFPQYLEQARALTASTECGYIDTFAGAASRLFGEGQKADPTKSHAAADVYDIADRMGKKIPADGIKDLSVITRIAVQRWLNIEEELKKKYERAGIKKTDKQIIKERQKIIRNRPWTIIINDESGFPLMQEIIKNNFYGHNPEHVLFVVQPTFHGYGFNASGKPICMTNTKPTPVGHGSGTMQVVANNRAFWIDAKGAIHNIKEDAESYLRKRTGVKYWIQGRVNDLIVMGYSSSPHPTLSPYDIDMGIMALALKMMGNPDRLDEGKNAVLEQTRTDPRIKGGTPLALNGKHFLMEKVAMNAKTRKVVIGPNPQNRFYIYYKWIALQEMKKQGLPVYFRFRDGFIYPETVTGDLTMLKNMNAGFAMEASRQLDDFKNPETADQAVEASDRQDKRPGFARCIDELRASQKDTRITGIELVPDIARHVGAGPAGTQAQGGTGAIRANGEGVSAEDHGVRTSIAGIPAEKRLYAERTLNGIIRKLIDFNRQAASLLPYHNVDSYSDRTIPELAKENNVGVKGADLDKVKELQGKVETKFPGLNFVILRGLKEELVKNNITPDLYFHYGHIRSSIYVDEVDFLYLLSLPDGLDLMMEAICHEVEHIKNPQRNGETDVEYEARIEGIALTKNVRAALNERDLVNNVQKLSRVGNGIVAGAGLTDIHGRKFTPDGRFFTADGEMTEGLKKFMDSLDEASVQQALEAGIMYYDIRSPFWRDGADKGHPEFAVAFAFAFAKKLQQKTGKKDGIVLHIGVDCYNKHFEAAQIFVDAILRTGICDNGGGIYYWGVINGGDMRNYAQLYDAVNGTGGNWAFFTMSHVKNDFLGAKLGIDSQVYCGPEVRHCEGVTSGTLTDAIEERDFAPIKHTKPEGNIVTISKFLDNNIQVAADMIRATSAPKNTPTKELLKGAKLCVDMNGSPIGKNLVDILNALGADVMVDNGVLEPDYKTDYIIDPNEHKKDAMKRLRAKAKEIGRVILAVDPDGDRGSIVAVGPDGNPVSLSGAKLLLLSMEQLAISYYKQGKTLTIINDMRTGVSARDLANAINDKYRKELGGKDLVRVIPHEAGYPFFMRGMAALPADLAVENTTHAFTNPMTNTNWGAPKDYKRPDGKGYQGGDNAALYLISLLGAMVHQWDGRNPVEQLDWIEKNYNLRPTVDEERKPALAKEDDRFKYMVADRMKELADQWFAGDERFLVNFNDPKVTVVSGVHITNSITGAMMLVRFSNTGATFTISGEAYKGVEGHETDELYEMLGLGQLIIKTAVEQLQAEGNNFTFDLADASDLAGKFDVNRYFPQGLPGVANGLAASDLEKALGKSDKVVLLGNAEVATYAARCGTDKAMAIPHGFFNINPQAAAPKDLTISVVGSVTTWSDMRWVKDVVGLVKEIRRRSVETKALGYVAGKFVPYKNPDGTVVDELRELRTNPDCIILKAEDLESAYRQTGGFTDLASFKTWLWERSDGGKIVIVDGEINKEEVKKLQASLVDFNTQMYRELLNGFEPKVEYSGTLHENPGSSIPVVFESPSMTDVASEGLNMVTVKFGPDGKVDFSGAAQRIIELIGNPAMYNEQRAQSLAAAQKLTMADVASRYLDVARKAASKKPGEAIRIAIVTPISLRNYGEILNNGFSALNAENIVVDLLVPNDSEAMGAFVARVKDGHYDVNILQLHGAHTEKPVAFEDFGDTKNVLLVHRPEEVLAREKTGVTPDRATRDKTTDASRSDGTIDKNQAKIVDLSGYAGLDIKLTSGTGELILGGNIVSEPKWVRPLAAAGNSIMNPGAITSVNRDRVVYYGYRNVAARQSASAVDHNHLRFDITVLQPGVVAAGADEEFIMTKGHIHPSRRVVFTDTTSQPAPVWYPEFYEVWSGYALYVQQGRNPETGEFEVEVTFAKPGDKVLLKPGYSHRTVNIGNEPLVMANWIAEDVGGKNARVEGEERYDVSKKPAETVAPAVRPDFSEIERKNGYAYWVERTPEGGIRFEFNPNYSPAEDLGYGPRRAQLRYATPAAAIPALGLSNSEPMYKQAANSALSSFLRGGMSAPERRAEYNELAAAASNKETKATFESKIRQALPDVTVTAPPSKGGAKAVESDTAAITDDIDPFVIKTVEDATGGKPLTGPNAIEIMASIKHEGALLWSILEDISKKKFAGKKVKQVVLLRDTDLYPTSLAHSGEDAVKKYLGDTLIEVSGRGSSLLDNARRQLTQLIDVEGKTPGEDFVVVTLTGNNTLAEISGVQAENLTPEVLNGNEKIKDLGKILSIQTTEGHILPPIIGLYAVALRLANDTGEENILRCLNSIAWNGRPNQPFTVADLARGVLVILPRVGPVNYTEVVEAFKAAEAVLRAL
ncbi:MAG: glucose-6-phosphate isomerase family protein [Candidatus Omnitrophota bacterium]